MKLQWQQGQNSCQGEPCRLLQQNNATIKWCWLQHRDPDDPDTSALLSVEAGLPTPGVPATRDWLRFTRVRGAIACL